MKKWISSEYQECLAFFKWAQFNPLLKDYLIKIVNEGKRSKEHGYYLKSIGLRAGLPDYHLPINNNRWRGLWIEMKTTNARNHAKRESQDEWIAKLIKIGHYACYAYGWQDAARITMEYLANKL